MGDGADDAIDRMMTEYEEKKDTGVKLAREGVAQHPIPHAAPQVVTWVKLTIQHVEEDFSGRTITTTEQVLSKFVDDLDASEKFFSLVQEAADQLSAQRREWWSMGRSRRDPE